MATPTETKSVWETLSRIDVSKHTENKNGFTYLSWAWAWQTLKDNYPDATFEKHLSDYTGLPFMHDPESGSGYVMVTVRAGGAEATEVFPVLDYKNKAIPNPNAMDVNTALQRGLTKAISYLGLGAYIYAGEDLPPLPTEVTIKGPGAESKKGEGTVVIAKIFTEFLPSMEDAKSLEKFWRDNKTAVEILKQQDPDSYTTVLKKFKQRKEEINDK